MIKKAWEWWVELTVTLTYSQLFAWWEANNTSKVLNSQFRTATQFRKSHIGQNPQNSWNQHWLWYHMRTCLLLLIQLLAPSSHPRELLVFSITDLYALPSYKASSLRNERVKGYHTFSSANCERRDKTNKNCLLKGVKFKSYDGAPGSMKFNHEEVQSLAMSVLLNHD